MDILRELRESRGMNMAQAAAALGMKYTTYVSYEKGERQPHSEQLITIAHYYGLTIDQILGRTARPSVQYAYILDKYAKLDDYGKQAVNAVLDIELKRCVDAEAEEAPKKVIPLFVAAAGPGEPIDGEPLDDYEVDADSVAQFAVRISGDSMEPELHDGDIVLCERRRPKTGELAVIMVNGFLYVKQYIEAYAGNIYLRSLNRARKDCDVDILASGNDTVTGYGTVIYKPLALVKE